MEYEFVISGRKADILCPSPDHLLDSFALLPLLFPSTLLPPFESNIFFFFFLSFLTRISSGQKKKNYSPMEKIEIKVLWEEHSFLLNFFQDRKLR